MLVRGFGGGGGFTGRSAPLTVTAGGGSGPGGACAKIVPAATRLTPQNPISLKICHIIVVSLCYS
jgi:hypothetical protein